MSIAILYICTGKYAIFWENFYKACEKNFIKNIPKTYYVFTDQNIENNDNVVVIYQEKLGWPYDTLHRFKMFKSIVDSLKKFDYIFFLNANMHFTLPVSEEILPENEGLLAVLHPGFYNKNREQFTYEANVKSLAYIGPNEGEHYFMGGFNGGKSRDYINLIIELSHNIDIDHSKGIIAVWHDESHLNRYLINKQVKILPPSYGYPEGWDLPFEPKIVVLDKAKYGGHAFLREIKEESFLKKILKKIKL